MPNKTIIPLALILMLILAACGGQQTAAPPAAAASASQQSVEPPAGDAAVMQDSNDETLDGSSGDDMAATDDNHDQDMGESQETMDDDHDQDMGDDDAMEDIHDDADMVMESDDEAMEEEGTAMMDLPVWQTLAVTNVATGEPFTLADFQGQTVFVEPMATWCSNCRTQQFEVQQAQAQLGDDVVFVGLSLETSLPAADLARYAEGNGFDWTYAVMSPELLAGLADEFGRSITSAPSTPHFIIRPDGSFSELSTGIHSAAEIITQIEAAQS